jgi:hypothetical protein
LPAAVGILVPSLCKTSRTVEDEKLLGGQKSIIINSKSGTVDARNKYQWSFNHLFVTNKRKYLNMPRLSRAEPLLLRA